jgi:hypothetical protein
MPESERKTPQRLDINWLAEQLLERSTGTLLSDLTVTQAARVRSMLRHLDWELTTSDARRRWSTYRPPGDASEEYGIIVQGDKSGIYTVEGSTGYIESSNTEGGTQHAS